jgi:hypothetical protein
MWHKDKNAYPGFFDLNSTYLDSSYNPPPRNLREYQDERRKTDFANETFFQLEFGISLRHSAR